MTDEMDAMFQEIARNQQEPTGPQRSSILAFLRHLRIRFVPSTISVHNDELGAGMRFPLGFTWRRWHGSDWCPLCLSISPKSLLAELAKVDYWNRDTSVAEMSALIERGEMSTQGAWAKVSNPPPGTAYGMFNYNPSINGPDMLLLAVGEERIGFSMAHLYDIAPAWRSLLLGHINRIAPMMEWSMNRDGGLVWAPTAMAMVSSAEEAPEEDPDEPDTESDPPQEEGDPNE